MSRKDSDPKEGPLQSYLKYSNVGLQFFVAVALFTGLGVWLDGYFGTRVLCTLLGLALGFAGGFYGLYRTLYMPRSTDGDADKPRDSGAPDSTNDH